LWLGQLALQVASAAALTGYTYFFVDDWFFTEQARTQTFGVSFLREPLFEHFSPITRLLDKLLVVVAPGSFLLAHIVELALYAAAIAAFAWVVRGILGNSWTAFALTILFGQSLFLIRLLNWWTATANILPATIFMLVAIGAYLRWRELRLRRWLAVLLAAFAGALLDYETALLLPAYLAVLSLLVLEPKLGPRAWISVLWRERWAWAGMAVLESAAIWNFYAHYYLSMPHPTAWQMLRYLWGALVESFVPALGGIKDPQAAVSQHAVVIAACMLAFVALIGSWVYIRPRAWRCVAGLAVVFAVTMAPVGYNRIKLWGVASGKELYYQQSLFFMFLVLVAFAVGAAGGRRRPLSVPVAELGRRLGAAPAAIATLGAALVAVYAVLFITSVHAMTSRTAAPEPYGSRAYVDAFRASVRRAVAMTGHYPVLIDSQIPAAIMGFAPFDHYDQFVPMVDSRVRVNVAGPPAYVLGADGGLLPVSFSGLTAGVLSRSFVTAPDGSGSAPPPSGSTGNEACVPAGHRVWALHIPLTAAQTTAPRDLPFGLRISVRMPRSASVPVVLVGRTTDALDQTYSTAWPAGAANEFKVLSVNAHVDAVEFLLPGGACIDSLSFGAFNVAGPPV
jgi:hypothetical protein